MFSIIILIIIELNTELILSITGLNIGVYFLLSSTMLNTKKAILDVRLF